ncbi:glycosyl hydrolase family 47 [Ophiostoma piceae UAMH 11346]|uniref:alpha-1,2-Mannosidase n=1 Tax=Ophiostoma piceae (strain UAMH 11346) TaxID=1262450 RepID=S3C575_OPHP1|nr:glycosyl hydrolase family 47 [Ophiostoma piceae UAMH 11346]
MLLSPMLFRRKRRLLFAVAVFLLCVFCLTSPYASLQEETAGSRKQNKLRPARASKRRVAYVKSAVDWALRQPKHPIATKDLVRLPQGLIFSSHLPDDSVYDENTPARIQYNFRADPDYKAFDILLVRDKRRDAVRSAFKRGWETYRQNAWGYDELMPMSLKGKDNFGGWGATLVDSLDTLWIMELHDEFDEAVRAVATIDWDVAVSPTCSLFETNIRYLGGLLSAYEMSGAKALLDKGAELAYMLLAAFDTPSHMPVNQLHFDHAFQGILTPSDHEAAAAVGTLSLEFTKMAQLTGDDRFFDAIDRIKRELARIQDSTTVPGLWPTFLDLQNGLIEASGSVGNGPRDSNHVYTLGGLSDSLYEYLPKMYQLLGGQDVTYRDMHIKAIDAMRKHLLFRPMIPDPEARGHDILMSGTAMAMQGDASVNLIPEVQHLACFAGGMFALGGRLFDRPEDVDTGMQLTQGCAWAYNSFHTGIMPEVSDIVPCPGDSIEEACPWNKDAWIKATSLHDERCPRGFTRIRDPRYMLRPEAVESVFLLYRMTGDRSLQETAWNMYMSIERSTATEEANAAIADVTAQGPTLKIDSMESFFFAETLKYLYLAFSDPDYFSLDEYVYNTEAHPFKVPRRKQSPPASTYTTSKGNKSSKKGKNTG